MASEIPLIDRACTGKTAYTMRRLAVKAANRIRRYSGDTTMQHYHCRYCGNWHLGHTEKSQPVLSFRR